MIKFVCAMFAALIAGSAALAGGFPVIVPHAYGDTVIEREPQRVLSLGRNDHDFLYALGVAPVAVREWWGARPYATWPWAEDARLALGAEPAVLSSTETNIEWIAAQAPDLIVAIYADLSEAEYRVLSHIAPVVTRPAGDAPWRTSWQDQLRQTALAVRGDPGPAEAIIAGLETKAAAIRAAHPVLEGKTATLADYRNGQVTLWSSDHAPSRFLASLGMTFPETLDARADASGWIHVSPENIDLIDLDAVIWPNGHTDELQDLAVYRQLRLAREGRSIHLPGSSNTLAAALWFQTPLSLRYAMDEIAPILAAALDGDPATAPAIPD